MYRKQLAKQDAPIGHYWCDALIVGGWDRGGGDKGQVAARDIVAVTMLNDVTQFLSAKLREYPESD